MSVALLAIVASGCTQVRETEPAQTATEQLLFSTAVDRVCDALAIQLPVGSKVYVDAGYVDDTGSKYLLATLRDRILRKGGKLVTEREKADLVFEPRVGALSVDRKKFLVGIPGFTIPIPLAGPFPFPELALYRSDRQQGVVKLALTSYDAASGSLHQSLDPAYAFSQRTDWTVLFFFGWQDNDLMPDPANQEWVGRGSFD
jgi:hypothetical protein